MKTGSVVPLQRRDRAAHYAFLHLDIHEICPKLLTIRTATCPVDASHAEGATTELGWFAGMKPTNIIL